MRSRSSILRRGGAELLSFSLIRTSPTHHHHPLLLHTSDQPDQVPPTKTQLSPKTVSLGCKFSLSGSRRRVQLSWRVHPWPGCRTLAGTVAGRQGVTVRSTAAHRGRRAGTSGLARVSACHGSRGHSRDTGQGTVGEPLAAARAAAATLEAAPASPAVGTLLLLLCWTSAPGCCWPVSLASVYGGATHPTVSPAHPVIRTGRGGANYTVLGKRTCNLDNARDQPSI